MNCANAQRLLSAERDRALDENERVGLEAHVAQCRDCQCVRTALAAAVDDWRGAVASTPVPDAERAWQDLRREIRSGARSASNRAWWRWTVPFAMAAAAIAIAAMIASRIADRALPDVARAEFVEVPSESSSVVYVDAESGWLVVWAVDVPQA